VVIKLLSEMINFKFKKWIIITTSTILILVVLIILFTSRYAKYLIEKQDEKWIGRQIKLSRVYANPFTGNARVKNLRIFEKNSDSVFISAKGLNLNFKILKMLKKTYEISWVSLNDPVIRINQNNKKLNFDDIINKFTPKEKKRDTTRRLHLNILKMRIQNGEIHYVEKSVPINYFIKNLNIESPGRWWNMDTIALKLSFSSGPSTGEISGDGFINVRNLNYRMAVVAKKYDLGIIQQYLRDLANYGSFSANLDASIKSTGNIKDTENVNASGVIALNDFHLGRSAGDDYLSFRKLILDMRKMNPKGFEYEYDSIILNKPYIKYERYDSLDNLQRMFGKGGEGIKTMNAQRGVRFNLIIEIANYVKVLSRNFFKSNYKIGRLAIKDGNIQFNDFSLNEKFSMAAHPFNMEADSVSKKNKRIAMFLKTDIKPYGNLSVNLSINPNDTGEFDLIYHLNKVPLTMFNPYVITYTSFPLSQGTLELNGKWIVRNGQIQSVNHLVLIDPKLAIRLKRKDTKRLPLPLIMAFIRERDNFIDYEIPISGDLKKPNFHMSDVVFDLLANIFIKPPSIPYMSHVAHINNEEEKYLTVKWMTRQMTISKEQIEFLKKMKDFLNESPDVSITVTPVEFEEKEKEYILFYEAKKKYYLDSHKLNISSFNKEDSIILDKMSVKDSSFVHFINNQVKDTMMFTFQEKCLAYLGKAEGKNKGNYSQAGGKIVDEQFLKLAKNRESLFRSFFKGTGIENRIKFQKQENIVPYNGFSFYRIDYKGDIPKGLKKAYSQMNE
jgi:Domain of Unknown Function (DUF748)